MFIEKHLLDVYIVLSFTCFTILGAALNQTNSDSTPMAGEITTTTSYSGKHDNDLYIQEGHSAVLGIDKDSVEETSIFDMSIQWSRDSGESLETDRHKTYKNGTLVISSVEHSDIGDYTCTISGSSKDGAEISKTFSKTIKVFILPEMSYHVSLHYMSKRCNDQLTNNKVDEIQSIMCPVKPCGIRDVKGTCTSILADVMTYELWIGFTILPIDGLKIPQCSRACMIQFISTNLETQFHMVEDFVKNEGKNRSKTLTINEHKLVKRMRTVCQSGYSVENIICLPCNPGSFSRDKGGQCMQCSPGTYQPEYGKTLCIICKGVPDMEEAGAMSKKDCNSQVIAIPVERSSYNLLIIAFTGFFGFLVLILLCWAIASLSKKIRPPPKGMKKRMKVKHIAKQVKKLRPQIRKQRPPPSDKNKIVSPKSDKRITYGGIEKYSVKKPPEAVSKQRVLNYITEQEKLIPISRNSIDIDDTSQYNISKDDIYQTLGGVDSTPYGSFIDSHETILSDVPRNVAPFR